MPEQFTLSICVRIDNGANPVHFFLAEAATSMKHRKERVCIVVVPKVRALGDLALAVSKLGNQRRIQEGPAMTLHIEEILLDEPGQER